MCWLNTDEQESSPPASAMSESWIAEAMRAQLRKRAQELSHAIRLRVLAALQKHSHKEDGQPRRASYTSSA
jgi:hypothetical protein